MLQKGKSRLGAVNILQAKIGSSSRDLSFDLEKTRESRPYFQTTGLQSLVDLGRENFNFYRTVGL